MKSTKIRNLTPPSEYNLDTFFIIVFIEENKSKKLDPQEIKKGITFILFNKFFDFLNCAKKDVVWQSFKINNFVDKGQKEKQIWTKKEYAVFIGIISRPKIEKTVYLRLSDSEKDNKKKEENPF